MEDKGMLDNRKIKAVELLLDGSYTMTEVAEKVGVSRQTFYRWRTQDEEFMNYYEERKDIHEKIIEQKFGEKIDVVSDTLFDIITNEEVENHVRYNAAKYWIDRVYGRPGSTLDLNNNVSVDREADERDILSIFEEDLENEKDED